MELLSLEREHNILGLNYIELLVELRKHQHLHIHYLTAESNQNILSAHNCPVYFSINNNDAIVNNYPLCGLFSLHKENERIVLPISKCQSPCWCEQLLSLCGTLEFYVPYIEVEDTCTSEKWNFGKNGLRIIIQIDTQLDNPVDKKLHLTCRPLEVTETLINSSIRSVDWQIPCLKSTWKESTLKTTIYQFSNMFSTVSTFSYSMYTNILSLDFILHHTTLIYLLWGPADAMITKEIIDLKQYNIYNSLCMKKLLPHCQFILLPHEFITWLHQDGIFLGETDNVPLLNIKTRKISTNSSTESNWDENDSVINDDLSSNNSIMFEYSDAYTDLSNRMNEVIKTFGGVSFPKFIWSAPKDAAWMTNDGSLRCSSAKDIFLLFKSSMWISHDLDKAYSRVIDPIRSLRKIIIEPTDMYIGLKEWITIPDGAEFRIFFWDNKILGVSQKDIQQAYSFLTQDKLYRSKILNIIFEFFTTNLFPSFPTIMKQQPYRGAADISCIVHSIKSTCRLLDISPWGATTDPLLFTYNELRDWAFSNQCLHNSIAPNSHIHTDTIPFRWVTEEMSGKRCNNDALQRVPQDILDMKLDSHNASDVANLLKNCNSFQKINK